MCTEYLTISPTYSPKVFHFIFGMIPDRMMDQPLSCDKILIILNVQMKLSFECMYTFSTLNTFTVQRNRFLGRTRVEYVFASDRMC